MLWKQIEPNLCVLIKESDSESKCISEYNLIAPIAVVSTGVVSIQKIRLAAIYTTSYFHQV